MREREEEDEDKDEDEAKGEEEEVGQRMTARCNDGRKERGGWVGSKDNEEQSTRIQGNVRGLSIVFWAKRNTSY